MSISFEGRTFSGPQDVLELLRSRAYLRPQDEHPWEWATRLAAEHPETRPWIEAALGVLFEETKGPDPGLNAEASEILMQAQFSGAAGLLAPLLERMHLAAAWPPAKVRALLDAILGFEMRRERGAGSALGPEDRARIAELGVVDGCLDLALSLLWDDPKLCADMVCAAIEKGSVERSPYPDRVLDTLARRYGMADFRRFRARVSAAFAGSSALLRKQVRRWGPRRPGKQRNTLLEDLYREPGFSGPGEGPAREEGGQGGSEP